MKKTLFALCLLTAGLAFGQSQPYSKIYYNQEENFGLSVVDDTRYGTLILGRRGDDNALLYKIDDSGEINWSFSLTNNVNLYPRLELHHATVTSDSAFIISGRAANNALSKTNAFCAKISIHGDTLWTKTFDDNGSSNRSSIIEAYDSTYLFSWGNDQQGNSFSVANLDQSGNLIWSQSYVTSEETNIHAMAELPDSSYLIAGHIDQTTGYNSGVLVNINIMGDTLWCKKYDSLYFEDVMVKNDYLLITGKSFRNNEGYVYWKSDLTGQLEWQRDPDFSFVGALDYTSTILPITDSTSMLYFADEWENSAYILNDDDSTVVGLRPNFRGAAATVVNQDVLMVGNGPIYGIKSIFQNHIGVIRTDSILQEQDCSWPINIYGVVTNFDNSQNLSLSYGTPPSSSAIQFGFETIGLTDSLRCVAFFGSVDEINEELEIEVYPNISSGVFTFKHEMGESISVTILSPVGQRLKEFEIKGFEESVDLSEYASGNYFYQATNSSGRSKFGTLILQKN